jgi:hypothetical protein
MHPTDPLLVAMPLAAVTVGFHMVECLRHSQLVRRWWWSPTEATLGPMALGCPLWGFAWWNVFDILRAETKPKPCGAQRAATLGLREPGIPGTPGTPGGLQRR